MRAILLLGVVLSSVSALAQPSVDALWMAHGLEAEERLTASLAGARPEVKKRLAETKSMTAVGDMLVGAEWYRYRFDLAFAAHVHRTPPRYFQENDGARWFFLVVHLRTPPGARGTIGAPVQLALSYRYSPEGEIVGFAADEVPSGLALRFEDNAPALVGIRPEAGVVVILSRDDPFSVTVFDGSGRKVTSADYAASFAAKAPSPSRSKAKR